ncbi:hypothetical protein C8R45DRAFT_505353 [Mycena sanguinolenta]|nr:hypothetical protein C8R45DRAFT_505353 [Mycena sanguinolenta]
MSVEELLARIDEISADIEDQLEVIRQLRISKSVAQRRLNALRDPIALLPVEISSEIFLQCLPSFPQTSAPGPHTAPMHFMKICKGWSDLALSTPALWAVIELRHSRAEVLQSWLHRARNCPLSIALHTKLNSDATAVFRRCAPQLTHLALYAALDINPSISFPCLETLTFDGSYLPSEIIKLFGLTPNLVRCTLPHAIGGHSDQDLPPLILPKLRYLEFGMFSKGIGLLNHLSLPALETLVIPSDHALNSSFGDFSLFLQRSQPQLRKLILASAQAGSRIQLAHLDECFHLLPSVAHVELVAPGGILDADLFTALADPESSRPNLRSLKIQILFLNNVTEPPPWHTVLHTLSARHPRLDCFHLSKMQHSPDAEILDEFQRLVADGMEIFIAGSTAN